ncbi:MarR family transcriptional regulator [Halobacillus fulvus]|nr:MarR family transcriptional regulator [Halobacillus fulvus]
MKREEIRDSIGYNIHVTSHLLQNVYNEKLGEFGLTHAQARVIYLLAVHGQQSQSDLQKKLYIQASSMNGIIESMLKYDRIAKKPSPTDKRTKMITLTGTGHELYEKIIDIISVIEDQVTNGLTKDEVESLVPVLRTMQENLRPTDDKKVKK